MLVPESIQNTKTKAIDLTWADRLGILRYRQLVIDFRNETNIDKLRLWLEMFGLSMDSLPDSFTVEEHQRLLQSVVLILRKSGTPDSIKQIAFILGASGVEIMQDHDLTYNGEASYNNSYYYDGGDRFKTITIRLEISGVAAGDQASFIDKLKHLFEISQPVWIYLERVDFV